MSARVKDVMTKRVVAVRRSATFKEIAAKLREERVSAFPVLDDAGRTVIGVVSEADLVAKEALEAGYEGHPGLVAGLIHRRELEKARAVTAGELMSQPPVRHIEGVVSVRDQLDYPQAEPGRVSAPLF